MSEEKYSEGYKAGYGVGFDDGKGAGYSDAKCRAYLALDAVAASSENEKPAVRKVEDALSRLIGKRQ